MTGAAARCLGPLVQFSVECRCCSGPRRVTGERWVLNGSEDPEFGSNGFPDPSARELSPLWVGPTPQPRGDEGAAKAQDQDQDGGDDEPQSRVDWVGHDSPFRKYLTHWASDESCA